LAIAGHDDAALHESAYVPVGIILLQHWDCDVVEHALIWYSLEASQTVHCKHSDDSAITLNVLPAIHAVQAVDPLFDENDPAEHEVHLV
jgi:hypothetical protein